MPDQKLQPLIAALADGDAATRENSARAIFRRGSLLLEPVLREWLADGELARCFLVGPRSSAKGTVWRDTDAALITVGVAVEHGRFDAIRAANGMPPLAEVPPDQDAREFELEFSAGVHLDILTSREPSGAGAMARYLTRFGEGIQQVEVSASNVARATEILRGRFGVQPIYSATRAGANGTRVNFFLVPLASGAKLLVELVES